VYALDRKLCQISLVNRERVFVSFLFLLLLLLQLSLETSKKKSSRGKVINALAATAKNMRSITSASANSPTMSNNYLNQSQTIPLLTGVSTTQQQQKLDWESKF
jgi:hypothetical protein